MSVKISNLPAATSVNSSDVVPIVQAGNTKKAAASLFRTTDASLLTSGTVDQARLPVASTISAGIVQLGSTSGTACEGNDSRLTNSRSPSGGAGGDLAGNYPNPTIGSIQGQAVDVTTNLPSSGQALVWNTVAWVPTTISGGGGGTGTVTSINVTGGNTGLTSVGGPVTTSGTIALDGIVNVLHGGTGASDAATARANLGANNADNITTGVLDVAQGGTGLSAFSNGQLLIGKNDGTLNPATLTAGSNVSITNGDGSITIGVTGLGTGTVTSSGTTTGLAKFTSATNITGATAGTDYVVPSGNITGTAGGLSSTLAVTSGGTGQTAYTDGQLLIGNTSTSGLSKATLTAGSGIGITNGNGSITISATGTAGVSTFSAGTTGFTPSTASSGAVTLAGTLNVANGGTGATTFSSGLIKSVGGTNALTSATAGTDYVIPSGSITGTAANVTGTVAIANGGTGQTTASAAFGALAVAGAQAASGLTVSTLIERNTVSATAATGTITLPAATAPVLYYTSNATANFTLNITGASTLLTADGQTMTVTFLTQMGTTAFNLTAVTVDGAASTPVWQNGTGSIPSTTASATNAFTFTVIRTAASTYKVLANLSFFK